MNKVLIVDDEPDMTAMISRTLRREGFEAETATTREEALGKMDNELYSLVVLDIKFPETSGQQLLREFNEINPLVNVIMITGHSTIRNVVECLGEGAVDYFTKPLDMESFIRSVKEFDRRVDRWRDTIGLG